MGITSVHLIVPLVLLGLWRKISKKDIPLWTVLLAGLVAIVIDMDVVVDFLTVGIETRYVFHRVWSHTMLWPVLLFAGAGLVRMVKKKEYCIWKWTLPKDHLFYAFLFCGIGLFSHLILDCALSGPFYLSWIPPGTYEGAFAFCRPWLHLKGNIALGGAVVVAWYSWMLYRKNFKDVV